MVTRWRLSGNTEFLIYAFSFVPVIFILAGEYVEGNNPWMVALLVTWIPVMLYYMLFRKRMPSLSLGQWIFGGLAMSLYLCIALAILLYIIGDDLLDSYNDDAWAISGFVIGGILSLGYTFYQYKTHHVASPKPPSEKPAP